MKKRDDYVKEVRLLREAVDASNMVAQCERHYETRQSAANERVMEQWREEADLRWSAYNSEVWINRYAE